MEKEDNKRVSTLYVNLKDHFDALWIERKEQLTLQFRANDERLRETAKELERRLETLNHAHAQSLQDRGDFITKREHEILLDTVNKIDKRTTIIETRIVVWTGALAFFFLLIELALKFFGR
jgi:hypothetical protein